VSGSSEAIRLHSPSGTLDATFLPHLGMVGSSLRHQGEELLAQRGGPDAYAESKSTFGIPLLHPWANRLRAWSYDQAGRAVRLDRSSPVLKADPDTGLPIHGALAACPYWQVLETGNDEAQVWVEAYLDYGAHQELMEAFPFAHRLDFRASLDDAELSVRLTVTATEGQVPIAFGFHPYLALGGSRGDCELTLPVARRVVLDEQGIPTGSHEEVSPDEISGPLAGRTFDDAFDVLVGEPPVFGVADAGRRVEVRYEEGYPIAQVYAPEDSPFIAFEPMTAPVDALSSGEGLGFAVPGRPFSAQFAIRVTPS
jgi:aldose 1-epimerase